MSKIYDAQDMIHLHGAYSHREWIEHNLNRINKFGPQIETPWNGKLADETVKAEIDHGRWIARCPDCEGAEYVSKSEKIFYCFSCGNFSLGGSARRVVFPADLEDIEKEILSRGVKERRGANRIQRAMYAEDETQGLGRCWKPGESVDELREQKRRAKEAKENPHKPDKDLT